MTERQSGWSRTEQWNQIIEYPKPSDKTVWVEYLIDARNDDIFEITRYRSNILPIQKGPDLARSSLEKLIDRVSKLGELGNVNPKTIMSQELPHALADQYGKGQFEFSNIIFTPKQKSLKRLGGSIFCYRILGPRTKEQLLLMVNAPKRDAISPGDKKLVTFLKPFPNEAVIPEETNLSPREMYLPYLFELES